MRLFLWTALVSSVAFACGGDSNSNDAGTDATADSTLPVDASTDASDAGADAKSDASPQDAGNDASCKDPSGCGQGAPVCCGTIVTGAGTPPACPVEDVTSACATSANCATTFGTCGTSETVRFCKQTSDCTETLYNKCCTFVGDGGVELTFGANATVADAGGGTCL